MKGTAPPIRIHHLRRHDGLDVGWLYCGTGDRTRCHANREPSYCCCSGGCSLGCLRLLRVLFKLCLDVVQVHGVEVFRVLAVSLMAKHLDLILTVFAFRVLSSRIGCHTNCPTQRGRLIFPVFDLRMAVLMSRLPLASETETGRVICLLYTSPSPRD